MDDADLQTLRQRAPALAELYTTGRELIKAAADAAALEQARVVTLGRKSGLTELLRSIPSLPPEERPLLGKSGNVSKGQHCRAEVFLERFGWVPVDPADVRKVVLEEPPGQLSIVDPKVIAVRKRLFGAWEMNWLAYNDAHDLKLPHSAGDEIPFLMYPQGEANGERFDSLDPDAFRYTLTATELG